MAIEHPAITFSFVLPSTVEGSFRSSAVDRPEGVDVYREVKKTGLSREVVAKRCIQAIDAGEKHVFIPLLFCRAGHSLYWWMPWISEGVARRKYNFTA